MTLTKEDKKEIMSQFGTDDKDTGSPAVQIAILTQKIENLKLHLKEHKKDNHSRRGIMIMVAKRRKMLNYLKKKDPEQYDNVIEKLSIRK